MMSRVASSSKSDWVHAYSGSNLLEVDPDGLMSVPRKIRIDLSQALSQRLGRQMSMMSTYKVNYIRIELLNVDNTNDNDAGALFQGKLHYWSPSKHRINAMQLARQVEQKQGEGNVGDLFGPLDNTVTYKGMRFNWDSDSQTQFATTESFSVLSGSEWDLAELFNTYEMSKNVDENTYTNALWSSGRCGYPEQVGWSASMSNMIATDRLISFPLGPDAASFDIYDPKSSAYELNLGNNPVEVLGGLLNLEVTHSSVENGGLTTINDQFHLRVTVGVTGWSDF